MASSCLRCEANRVESENSTDRPKPIMLGKTANWLTATNTAMRKETAKVFLLAKVPKSNKQKSSSPTASCASPQYSKKARLISPTW